ncbi:MAG: hypothetical protein Kapaf2KO_08470 [Candidatus Kapaibacteriales bacterium]
MHKADISENIEPEVNKDSAIYLGFGSQTGIENMETDAEMARLTALDSISRFRFYTWSPWAISLGANQSKDNFDSDKLKENGIHLVRRPTGGRAVYHAEELTYCVTVPSDSSEKNRKIYEAIHIAIAKGLANCSILTDFERNNPDFKNHYGKEISASCFSSSARYELKKEGKKYVGSAQRAYSNVLLQHGSILIGSEHLNIVDYMDFGKDDSETETKKSRLKAVLADSSTQINSFIEKSLSPEELSNMLIPEFENALSQF